MPEPAVVLQVSPAQQLGMNGAKYARLSPVRRADVRFSCSLSPNSCVRLKPARFRVNLTRDLEAKLSRWLVTAKS